MTIRVVGAGTAANTEFALNGVKDVTVIAKDQIKTGNVVYTLTDQDDFNFNDPYDNEVYLFPQNDLKELGKINIGYALTEANIDEYIEVRLISENITFLGG